MIDTARWIVLALAYLLGAVIGVLALTAEDRREKPSRLIAPASAALALFVGYLLLKGYALTGLLLLSVAALFWTFDQAKRVKPAQSGAIRGDAAGDARRYKLGCWTTTSLIGLIALAMILESFSGRY